MTTITEIGKKLNKLSVDIHSVKVRSEKTIDICDDLTKQINLIKKTIVEMWESK